MPKLLRPHIPYKVRCRVAMRQLGLTPEQISESTGNIENRKNARYMRVSYASYLKEFLLPRLRSKLWINKEHLDHDPALENREKVFRKSEHIGYRPDANDPDFLIYRDRADHDIKTRVRGEHGQFADNVIAKRERRRKKKATKRKYKWERGRKLQSRNTLRRRLP